MTSAPLLIFDTNVLMDVLLGRDGDSATLLVGLAEARAVDLVVPEYVLIEFRGTALRWSREEARRLADVRQALNEWARVRELDVAATAMKTRAFRARTHDGDPLPRRPPVPQRTAS